MGYALAEAAVAMGANTVLISGPTPLQPPAGAEYVGIETTQELHHAVQERFPQCDLLIMAAAPADFRAAVQMDQKIKRTADGMTLALRPTEDILLAVSAIRRPEQRVIGFALETHDDLANGAAKLARKKLDAIVVNNATEPGAGFDHDTNRVSLIVAGKEPEQWPLLSKRELADKLLERFAALLP